MSNEALGNCHCLNGDLLPCFGVICNPPKCIIRICNPLKPSLLAVNKQGTVYRITNPYSKNRRIANHAGTDIAMLIVSA